MICFSDWLCSQSKNINKGHGLSLLDPFRLKKRLPSAAGKKKKSWWWHWWGWNSEVSWQKSQNNELKHETELLTPYLCTFISLLKKDKDPTLCGSHRTILLLNVKILAKVLAHCLDRPLQDNLGSQISSKIIIPFPNIHRLAGVVYTRPVLLQARCSLSFWTRWRHLIECGGHICLDLVEPL